MLFRRIAIAKTRPHKTGLLIGSLVLHDLCLFPTLHKLAATTPNLLRYFSGVLQNLPFLCVQILHFSGTIYKVKYFNFRSDKVSGHYHYIGRTTMTSRVWWSYWRRHHPFTKSLSQGTYLHYITTSVACKFSNVGHLGIFQFTFTHIIPTKMIGDI